jgi:hypothetical protein
LRLSLTPSPSLLSVQFLKEISYFGVRFSAHN